MWYKLEDGSMVNLLRVQFAGQAAPDVKALQLSDGTYIPVSDDDIANLSKLLLAPPPPPSRD